MRFAWHIILTASFQLAAALININLALINGFLKLKEKLLAENTNMHGEAIPLGVIFVYFYVGR